jgi:hypothetical protein
LYALSLQPGFFLYITLVLQMHIQQFNPQSHVSARPMDKKDNFPENAYKKGRAISDPAYIDFYFFDGFKDPTVKLLATFLRDLIPPQFLENLNERMIH